MCCLSLDKIHVCHEYLHVSRVNFGVLVLFLAYDFVTFAE